MAPWATSSRSRAQALGDVWSGPGEGPSIYLYITRCKLICLARKNTFLLPSKLSCFFLHWPLCVERPGWGSRIFGNMLRCW